MSRITEALKEIMQAARHYLANPADPANRDRLSVAVEEAESLFTRADDLQGSPWTMMEGWDPSWSGTRCPSCGHLHPTTAKTVSALSTTCQACGAPMRIYAMEDLWAKADAGPKPTSTIPLEAMDPFAEKEISAELALLALSESDVKSGNLSTAQDAFRKVRGLGSRVPNHPGEVTNAETLSEMGEADAMKEIDQEVREVRRLRKKRSPTQQAELVAVISKVAQCFPVRRPEDLVEIQAALEALWKTR